MIKWRLVPGGIRKHRLRYGGKFELEGRPFKVWWDADDAWVWVRMVSSKVAVGPIGVPGADQPVRMWSRARKMTPDGSGVEKSVDISDEDFSGLVYACCSQLLTEEADFVRRIKNS